jgi:hypothetical protein
MNDDDQTMVTLAYDPVLRKVGCVLLQAVAGIDQPVVHSWNPDKWLLAPTPTLGKMTFSRAQWEEIAKADNEGQKPRRITP